MTHRAETILLNRLTELADGERKLQAQAIEKKDEWGEVYHAGKARGFEASRLVVYQSLASEGRI